MQCPDLLSVGPSHNALQAATGRHIVGAAGARAAVTLQLGGIFAIQAGVAERATEADATAGTTVTGAGVSSPCRAPFAQRVSSASVLKLLFLVSKHVSATLSEGEHGMHMRTALTTR